MRNGPSPPISYSERRGMSERSRRCSGQTFDACIVTARLFVGRNQAPTNPPLLDCVLVVVLWRQWMRVNRNDAFATALAPVYSRKRGCGSRFMNSIEGLVVVAFKIG